MSSRSSAAFTLLEVLAAVSILAILYTTLARVSMEGLRAEGESRRRLEASLLADQELASIELAMEGGTAPEEGVTESQVDDFLVRIEVAPYTLPDIADPQDPTGANAREGVLFGQPEGTPGGAENPLRQVDLSVSWNEGMFERKVSRTTYVFDIASIEDRLSGLSGGGGEGGEAGNGGVDLQNLPPELQQQARDLLNR